MQIFYNLYSCVSKFYAVHLGNVERVRELIKEPEYLHAADPHGDTALHKAAEYGKCPNFNQI